ncbi:MAG: HD domain-containing protein [Lachnospiraceae bacterium]|nr:HD domain-containing protein [Lachnospiraceae bacterium]
MKYIETLREGDWIGDIYLCRKKQSLVAKNGKTYYSIDLQDKTGLINAKVWDINSGIEHFEALDYIKVDGEVTVFQGVPQIRVRRIRRAQEGEFIPSDYLPVSAKDINQMYSELLKFVSSVKNEKLRALLESFFVQDKEFAKSFREHSAAKSVHHGFVGGLLEHTLSVTKMCEFYCSQYPVLKRDLLIAAALFHDIGKTKELSLFPENDYTDDGQLLGHIVIGTEMVGEHIRKIPGFPERLAAELKHCILAHHGEYEYGSPKKPAIVEAVALNFADNTDAKMQTFTEALAGTKDTGEWLGFNRLFDSNIRGTGEV